MIFELSEFISKNQVVPVCVFTPGRVGTIAVKQALLDQGVYAVYFHKFPLSTEVEYFKDKINRVITIVRDPIARMTTEIFFEHSKYGLTVADTYNPLKLIDAILKECESPRVFNWFEDEFRRFWDIDVYSLDFTDGGKYYDLGSRQLYILKTEWLGIAHHYLSSIATIPPISKTNITTDRHFGTMQPFLRDNLVVPLNLLDEIYSNKYCTHFYSEAEINKFKKRWSESQGEWKIDRIPATI